MHIQKFFLASVLVFLAGVSGFAQPLSIPTGDLYANTNNKAMAIAELSSKFETFVSLNKASESLGNVKAEIDESAKVLSVHFASPIEKRDSVAMAYNLAKYRQAIEKISDVRKGTSPEDVVSLRSLMESALTSKDTAKKISPESYDYGTAFCKELLQALLYEPNKEQAVLYQRGQWFVAGMTDLSDPPATGAHLLGWMHKKN